MHPTNDRIYLRLVLQLAEGTLLARELANEQADVANPEFLHEVSRELAAALGLEFKAVVGDELAKEHGLHLISAVGQVCNVIFVFLFHDHHAVSVCRFTGFWMQAERARNLQRLWDPNKAIVRGELAKEHGFHLISAVGQVSTAIHQSEICVSRTFVSCLRL